MNPFGIDGRRSTVKIRTRGRGVNPLLIFFRVLPRPTAPSGLRRDAARRARRGPTGSLRGFHGGDGDPRAKCPGRPVPCHTLDAALRVIRSRDRPTRVGHASRTAIIDRGSIHRFADTMRREGHYRSAKAGPQVGGSAIRRGPSPVFLRRSDAGARIGFDQYTLAHRGFTAEATLRFARAHRFDGVQFLDAASIDESLDPAAMSRFRGLADELGLYVEAGSSPSPNPHRGGSTRAGSSSVPPAERGW